MIDSTSNINPDSLKATFLWKIPAYVIGVLIGYAVVEIAMAWFA